MEEWVAHHRTDMVHIPGSPLSPQDHRWWTKTVHPHDGPTHHIPPHSLHPQNTLNQIHWGKKVYVHVLKQWKKSLMSVMYLLIWLIEILGLQVSQQLPELFLVLVSHEQPL